jgi:hypothetical protein
MVDSLKQGGWLINAQLTVFQNTSNENQVIYRIIDGAHRWTAIKTLAENGDSNNEKQYWSSYKIPIVVLQGLSHQQEMAIAYGNIFILFNVTNRNQ